MTFFWIGLFFFLGAFTQSVAGFGYALVVVPLLLMVLAPVPTTALVSLTSLVVQTTLILRYWRHLNIRALWLMILGVVTGIPIGIQLLIRLDERIILTILGAFLVIYSLYSLFARTAPKITGKLWDAPTGFLAGVLSGAFNTGGPPLVVYSVGKNWQPIEHKANLQILFTVSSVFGIFLRWRYGHFTGDVLQAFLVAAPATFIGTLVGSQLDDVISPPRFRKIVLVLLFIIGARLIFS